MEESAHAWPKMVDNLAHQRLLGQQPLQLLDLIQPSQRRRGIVPSNVLRD